MAKPSKRPRGLAALLARTAAPAAGDKAKAGLGPDADFVELPVDQLMPNAYQPRTEFNEDELNELAASVRANGILQPLVARRNSNGNGNGNGNGRYELIAGERRWRAAKLAGLKTVPVVLRSNVTDLDMLELSLLENIQREDLNPMEGARGYRKLIDEFGLTQEQIAEVIGRSRSAVANALRLLDLPRDVQALLTAGRIKEGHARVLLSLSSRKTQLRLATEAAAQGLSVRALERRVNQSGEKKSGANNGKRDRAQTPAHIINLQDTLSEHFGTKVRIEEHKRRGRIIIDFYSNSDFSRILEKLGVELQ